MLIWHYRAVMNFFAEDTIRRLHPMRGGWGGASMFWDGLSDDAFVSSTSNNFNIISRSRNLLNNRRDAI
jgi:hypothetical protein